MTDIILPSTIRKSIQEPGRPQIERDLVETARQLMTSPDDNLIHAMLTPTRRMWINILKRMKAENPAEGDQSLLDHLIRRIEATL